MVFLVLNFEVDDYDTWKTMFDEDPAGRRASGATGHVVVSRAVDNPNEVMERGGMRLKVGTDCRRGRRRNYVAGPTSETRRQATTVPAPRTFQTRVAPNCST